MKDASPPEATPGPDGAPPTVEELYGALTAALPPDSGLRPLPGLRLSPMGADRFHSLAFSARCECGTAAVLTVEVAREKSRAQVEEALPSLVERLEAQANAFYRLPCQAHRALRRGPGRRPQD